MELELEPKNKTLIIGSNTDNSSSYFWGTHSLAYTYRFLLSDIETKLWFLGLHSKFWVSVKKLSLLSTCQTKLSLVESISLIAQENPIFGYSCENANVFLCRICLQLVLKYMTTNLVHSQLCKTFEKIEAFTLSILWNGKRKGHSRKARPFISLLQWFTTIY